MQLTEIRRRLFFALVFLILIVLTLVMLKPFLTVIVVSLISVIVLKPVYDFFLGRKRLKRRRGLAASMTLISFVLILVIPLYLIVRLTASQLSQLLEQVAFLDWEAMIQEIGFAVQGLPFVEDIQTGSLANLPQAVGTLALAVAAAVAGFAVSFGSSLPSLFAQAIIFVVIVGSLLPAYDALVPELQAISPLGSEISRLYNRKITAMIKSLLLGVFLIAFLQGAVMGVFYWLAGLSSVFLLTVLSMFLALIPMVGISWLVIVIAVVSILMGNPSQAVVVLFGFYGVANWIDIALRPRLLSEDASLNFALFILAIFGGMAWAGVMGLFYGPVIMLLLVTTVQIYAERYAKEDGNLLDRTVRNLGRGDSASVQSEVVEA